MEAKKLQKRKEEITLKLELETLTKYPADPDEEAPAEEVEKPEPTPSRESSHHRCVNDYKEQIKHRRPYESPRSRAKRESPRKKET